MKNINIIVKISMLSILYIKLRGLSERFSIGKHLPQIKA